MPPKKAPQKKQSQILEEEANKMESIMAMLRGQIEEERAKVQPKSTGTRWAAAAAGPIGKFDSHGALARQILSKKQQKKPMSPNNSSPNSAKTSTPRSQSEKSATPTAITPPKQPKPSGKIEIVVEPQGGKLWGNYMADSSTQPDEGAGGALWGSRTTETSVQPDDQPRGGSLWGPHPDEQAENLKFKQELQKIRADNAASTNNTDIRNDEDKTLPPIGAGSALWGPPPDEALEQQKFQREIARFRGETVEPIEAPAVNTESASVGGNLVQKKSINPSGFTYFDRLVTKDILSGEPVITSINTSQEKQ